jgi:hypothetical protein
LFVVKTSKSGRVLKGPSLYGSPYADPYGPYAKKKKTQGDNFWSSFDFAGAVDVSVEL